MNRLELLHIIQDNADLMHRNDAVALLAGRLPADAKVQAAWEILTRELMALDAVG